MSAIPATDGRGPAAPAATAAPPLQVSVVVPTYRRPDLLARLLDAVLAQALDPAAYEVVVADDAASAATRGQVLDRAAAAAATGHTVRYVAVTGAHGPAAARNAGWQAAAGAVIAFTDDDCIPEPGWLQAGLAALADSTVMGAMGRIVVPLPPDPTDYERNAAGLEGGEFLTANCFYRRAALEAVGGLDDRFPGAWREDTDLWFRMLRREYPLVRAPDAVVVHPIRPAPWGISLRQQQRSMYNALLYKNHPELYIGRVQPGPPWRYYRVTGAGLAALALALAGHRRLALLPAAGWLVWTARFAATRLQHTSHAPAHVAEMIVTSLGIPPLSIFWRVRGAIKYRVRFL